MTDFVLGKNYDSVGYNCFINWEDIIMHYRYINFYIISLDLMGVSNVRYFNLKLTYTPQYAMYI